MEHSSGESHGDDRDINHAAQANIWSGVIKGFEASMQGGSDGDAVEGGRIDKVASLCDF